MIEFFQNIFNWFVENKDEIVLFFTSSNFIAFISAIVLFVKQIKTNKKGNLLSGQLKTSLDGSTKVVSDVVAMKEITDNTNAEVKKLEDDLSSFKSDVFDTMDTLLTKLNAVVEVQSIVYSTLKDESMRKNINSILIDAKYAETATRAALTAEIEELKQKVSTKMEDVKEVVDAAATKVKKVVSSPKKSVVPRY